MSQKRRLTENEVLYCREHYQSGDPEWGIKALSEKLGVSRDSVKDAIHGVTHKNVGGKIHPPRQHLSEEIKQQLIAAYVPQSHDANIRALAEQFNLSETTVLKYIHTQLPKGKRAVVTDELRAKILAEYQPYSATNGRSALAEKYGLSSSTVGNILKELEERRTRGRKPTVILDEIKEAIVIAHDEEQLSVRALAERFSLNRLVIREILKEAGVEVRTRQIISDEVKQEVIQLYSTGNYSVRELSERFNINRATLTKWVEDIKPPKPQKPQLDDKTREQIYRYHSNGYGSTIIAKTVGISQSIVRKVIDGLI